ncbi:XopAU family type III secretion system effector serine/threonine kinase [Acidovorax sp. NCPPB 4044]|uniref:XopAU family type III secretion system effector serine/threonine kinase n=1 Tax=Acidovorax sp. NCPPB 4044 TaxID=2940490 RepID=UPI0023041B2D|nr:XopAU family type III secretion system effector serine/threonine kinase [Acidovorax sp. NCPPB 4044]
MKLRSLSGSPERLAAPERSATEPAVQADSAQRASSRHEEPLQPLLTRRRLTADAGMDGGLRINALMEPLRDLRLDTPRSMRLSTPGSRASPFTPGTSSSSSSQSNSPTLASLVQPATPLALASDTEPWSGSQALKRERSLLRDRRMSGAQTAISPRLAKTLSGVPPSKSLWSERISALKPAVAETGQGFAIVSLDTSSGEAVACRRIGDGASGKVYRVRLSENFVRDQEDCGRDFVFKAMLSLDPADRLPLGMYQRHSEDPEALAQAIEDCRSRICKEFQIAESLRGTSQVMQVHGLVQIGHRLGLLSESIDGVTARKLFESGPAALAQGHVTPAAYFQLARTMAADVLVGLSRFDDEGVAHQDISDNNVMYDSRRKMFRIVDMGHGGEHGEDRSMGTWGFVDMQPAPAGHKSDVYAAGQLLACSLKDPGVRVGLRGIHQRTSVESFPFMGALRALGPDVLEDAVRVFNRMTVQDPEDRATAAELLKDPFFQALEPRESLQATYCRVFDVS